MKQRQKHHHHHHHTLHSTQSPSTDPIIHQTLVVSTPLSSTPESCYTLDSSTLYKSYYGSSSSSSNGSRTSSRTCYCSYTVLLFTLLFLLTTILLFTVIHNSSSSDGDSISSYSNNVLHTSSDDEDLVGLPPIILTTGRPVNSKRKQNGNNNNNPVLKFDLSSGDQLLGNSTSSSTQQQQQVLWHSASETHYNHHSNQLHPRVSEYIHLYKLPPPLDNDDLSENLRRNNNNNNNHHHNRFNTDSGGGGGSSATNTRHHYYNTGVFRPPNSRLWDPHPQYIFHAFNKRFHLVLNQITKQHSFIVPGFKVTTHRNSGGNNNNNELDHESWVSRRGNSGASNSNDQSLDEFEGCFYNGYVLGDFESSVAVSLCGGMTGHIRTSTGSYFIQPRRYANDLEHEIYKIVTQPHDDINENNNHHHHNHQHQEKNNKNNKSPTSSAPAIKKNLKITPYDYYSDEDYDSEESDEEEDDDDEHVYQSKFTSPTVHRSKRSLSTERYVELTVVTDQTMSKYHGENLKHYVLTLLSIVSLVYKDASIGNPVNIVLVNFHVLTDTDFSGSSGSSSSSSSSNSTVRGISASEMLRNFCKWQKEHNHPDDRHALHHDTALLLTRETICRNPWVGKCDTLGLAELGTMCDHYASCAIVQDNGLSAAFTIAHELGHVMNMPHDDDYKCQGFVDKVEGFNIDSDDNSNGRSSSTSGVSVVQHYVMSRMLDHNTYPWAWSRCSRHFLTEFLDAGHGYCLEDKPHSNLLSNDDENAVEDSTNQNGIQQPGEIFSEHKQCELVFGPTSQLCSYMPPCRRLWCTNHGGPESEESEGCRTQHMPWADGTRCGANKWCQRGQCVLKDLEKLKVINGGWGDWQDYGECSRPCGGGVRKSYRECDNPKPKNGGKYCVGPRVRYESCNTFECSNSSSGYDFRGQQCADYNGDNFNIHGLPEDVVWVPKYNGISPKDRCKLFCRVQGSSSYYLLKEKVIDGTPCGIDTFDVCVNGACLPAGCDRRLHSTSTLDICGICGGDGSTCTTSQGSYNSTKYGYNLVLRIPSGASNIDIRQRSYDNSARDDNYLALLDPLTNEYILNGHFVVSMFRKTIAYGGSLLEYSGSDQIVERINSSSRALKRDLEVRVLSVGKLKPPDIVFQYVISTSSSSGNSADDDDDNDNDRTVQQSASSYEWVGRRRANEPSCSSVCSGVTLPFNEWECQRRVEGSQGSPVDKSYCSNVQKPPHNPEQCNTHCSLSYRVTCPESCVHARNRSVECVRTLLSTNTSQRINEKYCVNSGLQVPDTPDCIRECRERGARWRYTQWSECTGRCSSNNTSGSSNNGYQIRNVWCQRFNWRSLVDPGLDHFVVVGDEECSGEKPIERRGCRVSGVYCGEWKIDQWSPCSTTCGPGRTRALYACVMKTHSQTQILPPDYCTHSRKPTVERTCEVIPCASYATSNWSRCDCATNTETRNITCMLNDKPVDDNAPCERLNVAKPVETRDCLNSSCVDYVVSEWSRDCRMFNGNYYRYRSVSCESGTCSGPKPDSKMECGEWRIESGWGGCNGSCSVGVEVRDVKCYLRGVKAVSESDCEGAVGGKPATTRKCYHNCGGHVKSLTLGGTRGEEGYGGGVINDYYYVNNNGGSSSSSTTTRGSVSYKWVSGSWGKCTRMTTQKSSSSSCPPPTSPLRIFKKHRQVKCVAEVTQPTRRVTTLPIGYCSNEPQPETSVECSSAEIKNLTPCPLLVTSDFTPHCIVAKDTEVNCAGNNTIMRGVKTRTVQCVHDTNNNTAIDLRQCVGGDSSSSISNIETTQQCVVMGELKKHCSLTFHWRTGPWSPCQLESGKKCGGGKGKKTRVVECTRNWKGIVVVVGDEFCGNRGRGFKKNGGLMMKRGGKPRVARECTRSCGGGNNGVVASGSSGSNNKKSPFKWVQGDWSACSRPCGGYGLRSRLVTCHRTNHYDWIDPDALPTQIPSHNNTNYCPLPKPKEHDYCMVSETCPPPEGPSNNETSISSSSSITTSPPTALNPPPKSYAWATSNYTECACDVVSKSNITIPSFSFQKRRVYCTNTATGQRTPARHCSSTPKPKRKRKCECNAYATCEELRSALISNLVAVRDGEYLLKVGGKLGVKVYCHGMTELGSVPKEYITLVNEDNNFSEIYDKRLIRPESCPRNGSRMMSCECVHDKNRRVGVTRWRKVRVNITNLRVDVDDFTFTTSSQDQIPYATAGDCYSSSMVCPQGRFSIDFRSTPFAVSPFTQWVTTGHRATMRVARKSFNSTNKSGESSSSKNFVASQFVQGKCGGYCATCGVTKNVGLRVDVV